MSLSLLIRYRDAHRNPEVWPFCIQSVLRDCWWPLAKDLRLPMLEMLEVIHLDTSDGVRQLIAELEVAREFLARLECDRFTPGTRDYMIERASMTLGRLRMALEDWGKIKYVSL
jgi:hypothetical protein